MLPQLSGRDKVEFQAMFVLPHTAFIKNGCYVEPVTSAIFYKLSISVVCNMTPRFKMKDYKAKGLPRLKRKIIVTYVKLITEAHPETLQQRSGFPFAVSTVSKSRRCDWEVSRVQ
jgi:hypothetical protein